MKSFPNLALMAAVFAFATGGLASAAPAAAPENKPTPKSWKYEIKDGKRVPRGKRVENADGSWREEIRRGNCVTIKQKSAAGEYKESRRCD